MLQVLFTSSSVSSTSPEKVAECNGPDTTRWYQPYWPGNEYNNNTASTTTFRNKQARWQTVPAFSGSGVPLVSSLYRTRSHEAGDACETMWRRHCTTASAPIAHGLFEWTISLATCKLLQAL